MTVKNLPKPDLSNLSYDPDSGILIRIKPSRNAKTGEVGRKNNRGYRALKICNKSYLVHRVAFWLMGKDPTGYEVDHINGIRDDNRWVNIRLVDRSSNQLNRKSHRDGRYRYTSFNKRMAMWVVTKNKKYYGQFKTESEAIGHVKELKL